MTTSAKAWLETPLGQRFHIPETDSWPVVIGRASRSPAPNQETKLEIPQSEQSMTVSRRHALLYRNEAGGYEIEDAGSTAGMMINGAHMEKGERFPVLDGTEITLGSFELTFRVEQEAEKPAPAPEPEETGDKTMVVGDFAPSVAPEWFTDKEGAEDETPDLPESDRVYLDLWLDDTFHPVEIPQPEGINAWTIGRAAKGPADAPATQRHVALPDQTETRSASRIHAMLTRTGEAWTLQNLSRQGIYVSGRSLKGEDQTALAPGDHIALGTLVLVFRQGPPSKPATAEDFALELAVGASDHETTPEEADGTNTRPLPKGVAEALKPSGEGGGKRPWGFLTENKLVEPLQFALTDRKMRIGSHPLNCEIKMDGPGITDVYAVLQWGQRDLRITSKSSESPVRINHTAYRTSPSLKTGDVVTLGNQEFRLEIVGEPPVATSSLVSQRIRRIAVVTMAIVILVFFGGLVAVKRLVPAPQSTQAPAPPDPRTLIQNVVRDYGLAGLKLLEESEVGQGELGREYEPVLDALRTLNQAHAMIHKLPARTFGDNVGDIETKIEEGRNVFELAGLSASLVKGGWFEKDIEDVFLARRESAYGTQWTDFLRSLEQTNIANAKNQLDQMTHFPAAKLQAARNVVTLWEKISAAAIAKNEDDILREFRKACNKGASYAYIRSERERLDQLNADFQRIASDPGEPARALTKSERWKQYHTHARSLLATLKLLEYYQSGEVDAFLKAVGSIDPGDQGALIATMKENLKDWVNWQAKYQKTKDPLSDFRLLAELQQIDLKFKATLDEQCSLASTIQKRVDSFKGARLKHAESLRKEAENLPDGFDKLNKLISAYEYDPNDEALEDLDAVATQLCGRIQQQGSVAANRKKLEAVIARYESLAESGVLTLDHIVSGRQMRKLLESAGR